jgi:hypothetical protein
VRARSGRRGAHYWTNSSEAPPQITSSASLGAKLDDAALKRGRS